jgi:hypothetical protein
MSALNPIAPKLSINQVKRQKMMFYTFSVIVNRSYNSQLLWREDMRQG